MVISYKLIQQTYKSLYTCMWHRNKAVLRRDSGLSKMFEFGVMWVCFYIALIHNEMGEISFMLPRIEPKTLCVQGQPSNSELLLRHDRTSRRLIPNSSFSSAGTTGMFKPFGLMKSFIYLKLSIHKCKHGESNTVDKFIYFEGKVNID